MTVAPGASVMPVLLSRPLAELPDPLPLAPLERPFNADITPPGSKSLTNRALLLAALARGESLLRRPLTEAVDAERMMQALRLMGAEIRAVAPGEHGCPDGGLRVGGVGGRLRGCVDLELGNAGTATRFLAAASALADGPVVIDGSSRMRERPIGELAVALRGLGAGVEFLGAPDHPPLRITPGPAGEIRRSHLVLPTTASSQFISALLLIAPWTPRGLTLELKGGVTSAPYISMTLGLLAQLGARDVKAAKDLSMLHVGPGPLAGFEYDVEPDASGASYFWAAAAMTPGAICRVPGLSKHSLQGDARFVDVLAAMGATTGAGDGHIGVGGHGALAPVKVNLAGMPDTAMTLAAACCFAAGVSHIRGLRTLRIKETDRISALQAELAKIGVEVLAYDKDGDESIAITPPAHGVDTSADAPRVVFDTYDDHRMAMSLALIGLRRPNVWIRDPACVSKTYPTFWADLARLYGAAAGPARP